jgi:hypothetical protein
MTIEELLRAAAAKGLTHLTLYPVESEDRKTTYWHARATPSSAHSYVQIATTDPVEAVVQVLKALPGAKKRVTATVNPDRQTTHPGAVLPGDLIEPQPPGELETWLPKA